MTAASLEQGKGNSQCVGNTVVSNQLAILCVVEGRTVSSAVETAVMRASKSSTLMKRVAIAETVMMLRCQGGETSISRVGQSMDTRGLAQGRAGRRTRVG